MWISRRNLLATALAAPVVIGVERLGSAAPVRILNISHQFPASILDRGDFRDRLCRKFAADLHKATEGALSARVYPEATLVKTVGQFAAMRKAKLDMSLFPVSYSGDEFPELNIGMMPGLVSSYRQGAAWKHAKVGQLLQNFLHEKGIVIISWIWQAGGVASRSKPVVLPEDVRNLRIRGGSREMDMVLSAAGAATLSITSNEIYSAMQARACDAAITSSTSLISFALAEVSKFLTAGRGRAYWYMFEPLLMSKSVFDSLQKDHQDIVMNLGADMEQFGTQEAMADDHSVVYAFARARAKVYDLTDDDVEKWRVIARRTAWKAYAAQSPLAAELIRHAQSIPVA